MKVEGRTAGLKSRERKLLERLAERRTPPAVLLPQDYARRLAEASLLTGRQIGILVNRRGAVTWVGVGDAHGVEFPDLKRQRVAGERLRGLRAIRTELPGTRGGGRAVDLAGMRFDPADLAPLTLEDLTDLLLMRLDLMAVLTVGPDGLPGVVRAAHLNPPPAEVPWELLDAAPPSQLDLDCGELVAELERRFARRASDHARRGPEERAILAGVTEGDLAVEEDRVEELGDLARDAGLSVMDRVLQRRGRLDPGTLLGRGKLRDLVIRALMAGADAILFSRDLTPSQARNISALTDLKVLDRTQLILDVFARRARSREGKLQVELAQLRYRLPRLVQRDTSLSRLGGGIGGRGPGETRLEVDRRRTRERIGRLTRDLRAVAGRRDVRRRRREARGLPVVSLVGYTNAGKSTLLNRLTRSAASAGDRMFETLDPTSRRLRAPVEREVLLADTVGFIHDLPEALLDAFRATLEEISAASVLLHVMDAADRRLDSRRRAVDALLERLGFADIPRIVLMNKVDRLAPAEREAALARVAGNGRAGDTALPVSARTGEGLDAALSAIAALIPMRRPAGPSPHERVQRLPR